MNNPLRTIQKIYQFKYPTAEVIFWGGSIAKNKGTSRSDLDIVVVYKSLANAYREAFIQDGWPIDSFVNDEKSLLHFFDENKKNGTAGLLTMVSEGIEVPSQNSFSIALKQHAQSILKQGPTHYSQQDIDSARFAITDLLDDIVAPASEQEELSSVIYMYPLLAKFYLRVNNQWACEGKNLTRRLTDYNFAISQKFHTSFNHFSLPKAKHYSSH